MVVNTFTKATPGVTSAVLEGKGAKVTLTRVNRGPLNYFQGSNQMSDCELMSYLYGLEPHMVNLIAQEWSRHGLSPEVEAQKAVQAWVRHGK